MLSFYKRFEKYFGNLIWLFSEKFLSLSVSFLSTAYIARVYGPGDFGIISYALSLTSLFAVAGHAGLSGLLVREIVRHPKYLRSTMGNGFLIKSSGYFLGFLTLNLLTWFYLEISKIEKISVSVCSLSLLIQPLCVLEYWFQSQMKNKYISIGKQISSISTGVLKFSLAISGFSIIYIVSASVFQVFLFVLILIYFYKRYDYNFSDWSIDFKRAKNLIGQAGLSFLGSIFAIIYLKIDQIMIREFLGNEAVGIYSVAVTLSEVWFFVSVIIASVFYPKLIKLRQESNDTYEQKLQQLFDLMFIIGVAICVGIIITSEYLILNIYGQIYSFSATVLKIHVLALPLIFIRSIISKWIMIEDLLIFSVITQGSGAIVNVILNYFWIEKFGLIGAAYSTIISYAVAAYFSMLFTSKTRVIFFMVTKSFFTPVRYFFLMSYKI